jgi:hypothetical protein
VAKIVTVITDHFGADGSRVALRLYSDTLAKEGRAKAEPYVAAAIMLCRR